MCQFFFRVWLNQNQKIASKQKLEQELIATGQNTIPYLNGMPKYQSSTTLVLKWIHLNFKLDWRSGVRLTQNVFITQNFDAGILTFRFWSLDCVWLLGSAVWVIFNAPKHWCKIYLKIYNNVFYLSIEYRFYLLLRLTKGPRMLHYRTGPFWQQFHPFLHYNDAHIGSIGSLMIAVAAGIAALAVCLRNRALFDPPNTVMSPLSTWPRTPIPHLQQFSCISTVIYDLSYGSFSRGM